MTHRSRSARLLAVLCILLIALPAFAVPTALTPLTPKGPYPGTVNASDLLASFTACDVGNGNSFAATGREILLVQNIDGALAHNLTITSVADSQNRKADITTYSVAANGFAVFEFSNTSGWIQSNGTILVSGDNVNIKFLVIRF